MNALKVSIIASSLVIAIFVMASPLLGQSKDSYDLSWFTVDGGGSMFSTGGEYTLDGTAGQPDTGTQTGGEFSLVGGFWAVVAGLVPSIPLPIPGVTAWGLLVMSGLLLVVVMRRMRSRPKRKGLS